MEVRVKMPGTEPALGPVLWTEGPLCVRVLTLHPGLQELTAPLNVSFPTACVQQIQVCVHSQSDCGGGDPGPALPRDPAAHRASACVLLVSGGMVAAAPERWDEGCINGMD